MITKVEQTSVDVNFYEVMHIDSSTPRNQPCKPTVSAKTAVPLGVGDIVEPADNHSGYFIRKHYNYKRYKPAIVLSADMISGEDINKSYKLICAFSKEFGDIRLTLKTNNPFFYTKSGDEIIVYQTIENGKAEYEIATNNTADNLRAKFLQQIQKQK